MSAPAWLAPELTTIAFAWRLERRDGVTIGFTTHDRDLTIGGLPYRAAPGMLPSALALADGFEVGTIDVAGALTSEAITEADLLAGRWDGARLRLFAVNWDAPDDNPLAIARGEIGDIASRDGAFSAELRGPTALLEAPVSELTSPECRAELGDARCRVDMSGRTRIVTVIEAIDALTLRLSGGAMADGLYAQGRLRWLDGPNGGLASAILASSGDGVTLREPAAFIVGAGVRAMLIEGCDKRLATCAARFANAANFRGEPHLPGNDLLTRYPGA